MRGPGAVGERHPRPQGVTVARQLQGAFAFGHKLHGQKRECAPLHPVIRTHPLAAPAHNYHPGAGLRREIQIITPSLADLGGNKAGPFFWKIVGG